MTTWGVANSTSTDTFITTCATPDAAIDAAVKRSRDGLSYVVVAKDGASRVHALAEHGRQVPIEQCRACAGTGIDRVATLKQPPKTDLRIKGVSCGKCQRSGWRRC